MPNKFFFILLVKWNEKDLVPQAGRKKGLRLILDAHSDHLSGGTVTEDFDGFYAIIDSNKQFPTVTRKTVLIRPGHENIVSMGATKVSATRHIKKLDKDKRVCLFGDEFEMNVHQEYTQANCLLECAMEYSISIVSFKLMFENSALDQSATTITIISQISLFFLR